ncbi:MAG: hypothetical protein QM699_03690 [Amaricoccus sp.]|uniref:hypothetical protein n=1 Tax=Amaricoccus sp. TaxID=1872485 RepID=UPI0039E27FE7
MRRRILVTASAMILATQLGSPAAAAEPTTEQLSTISSLLESNDVEGLRGYLTLHPDLAEGDSPLAALLRRFMVESVGGNEFFSYRNRSGSSDGGDSSDSTPSAGGPPGAGY